MGGIPILEWFRREFFNRLSHFDALNANHFEDFPSEVGGIKLDF
jgi:hypothetical protein